MDARGRTRAQAGASPSSIAGGAWRRGAILKRVSNACASPKAIERAIDQYVKTDAYERVRGLRGAFPAIVDRTAELDALDLERARLWTRDKHFEAIAPLRETLDLRVITD